MPKAAASRLAVVHPASTSRIERAAAELDQVRAQIAELEARKQEISARLLTMTKHEGEADAEGKIRYETDQHKFCVIGSKNVYCDPKKLAVAMTSAGITPKIQATIRKACIKETPYEYVGVYAKKQAFPTVTPAPTDKAGA